MTSIITSIKDLITSIFEVIFSVVKNTLGTGYELLLAFIDFFAGIPKMLEHIVKGSSEAVGGVRTFITSEFLMSDDSGKDQANGSCKKVTSSL